VAHHLDHARDGGPAILLGHLAVLDVEQGAASAPAAPIAPRVCVPVPPPHAARNHSLFRGTSDQQ